MEKGFILSRFVRSEYVRLLWCFVVVVMLLASLYDEATSEVFFARDEALERAFPSATEVVKRTFILTKAQQDAVTKSARAPITEKIVTFHEGRHGEEILGYALITSEKVRSYNATFLVKIATEGSVLDVILLAFHEPPDYIPSKRWLEQFNGKNQGDTLVPGRDIVGIMGSTLSTAAISRGVRRSLAIFRETIGKKKR